MIAPEKLLDYALQISPEMRLCMIRPSWTTHEQVADMYFTVDHTNGCYGLAPLWYVTQPTTSVNVRKRTRTSFIFLERDTIWKIGCAYQSGVPIKMRPLNGEEQIVHDCFGDPNQIKKDLSLVTLFQ